MHSDTWRRLWRAPLLLLLLLCTLALAPSAAQAQPAPVAALQGAADLLARDGYVASFTVTGGAAAIDGEVRYQSPLAYSLLIEDDHGTGFEYVILDTDLYSHDR